jgi:hypothetical protein
MRKNAKQEQECRSESAEQEQGFRARVQSMSKNAKRYKRAEGAKQTSIENLRP